MPHSTQSTTPAHRHFAAFAACALALTGCQTASFPDHKLSTTAKAEIREAMSEVDAERAMRIVEKLTSFGTRHTLSPVDNDIRGIGAAQRWVEQQLANAGVEAVIDETFIERAPRLPDGGRVANVIGTVRGTDPNRSEQRIYLLAHLDSRASDVMDSEIEAPGANDDASGCAVLLEVARALAKNPPEIDCVFVFTSGEEQGLLGARALASAARERGEDIIAVLNNDVVGDPTSPEGFPTEAKRIRLFAPGLTPDLSAEQVGVIRRYAGESDTPTRQLGRFIAETARLLDTDVQPMVIARTDRFLRGGDHYGFLEAGFPGVRFTEVHEHYNKQHQDIRTEDGIEYGDTAEHVNPDYMAGVARLNLATTMRLANAPAQPARPRLITAALTNNTTIRWDANTEPDIAGYTVLWRDTTAGEWQHAQDVGNTTEATLNLSKDNWFFGIRAYDNDGYASPVAFPEAARE